MSAAVEGYKASYLDKFAFLVVINGFARAGFSNVTGLNEEAEVIEYREGGHLRPHKSPGTLNSNEITLERGETDDADLFDWWEKVYNYAQESGGVEDADYKLDFQIVQLDRGKNIRKTWNVYGSWPSSFNVDDFDASANEKHMERIVLQNDGFERA